MAASSSRSNAMETIVEPQGEHKATIVWLHDNDGKSSKSLQFVKNLRLDNIKWICLDTGIQRADLGVGTTTLYKVGSPMFHSILHELDFVADRVASKLSTEKKEVAIGVGGIGIGAQVALHFATKCALGHYPMNPRVVIGINGWLFTWRSIRSMIESKDEAANRAGSQSVLITSEKYSDRGMLPSSYENLNVGSLIESGFIVTRVQFPVFKFELYDVNIDPSLSGMISAWVSDMLMRG